MANFVPPPISHITKCVSLKKYIKIALKFKELLRSRGTIINNLFLKHRGWCKCVNHIPIFNSVITLVSVIRLLSLGVELFSRPMIGQLRLFLSSHWLKLLLSHHVTTGKGHLWAEPNSKDSDLKQPMGVKNLRRLTNQRLGSRQFDKV